MKEVLLAQAMAWIGLFYVLLGLAGAVRQIFPGKTAAEQATKVLDGGKNLVDPKVLEKLAELIKAILQGPSWFVVTAAGIAVIFTARYAF